MACMVIIQCLPEHECSANRRGGRSVANVRAAAPNADVLIDTDVLVGAFDTENWEKHARASDVLDVLGSCGRAAASARAIGEFYSEVVRRFAHLVQPEAAVGHALGWAETLTTYDISVAVVLEALRGVARHQLPYREAELWACARVNGISLVLSEGLDNGTVVEGVRFVNPFAPGVDLDACLTA